MPLTTWWRLLRDNRFAVSPRYWPRALTTTLFSAMTSLSAAVERGRYADEIDAQRIPPPLFVLGHWRSGTTFLHQLLAQDGRFAYPTLYQVWNPLTFLTGEKTNVRLQRRAETLPSTRGLDDVELDLNAPYEDEFAGWHCSTLSSYMAWSFPDAPDRYDDYLTFDRAAPEDLAAWKRFLLLFYRKLTLRYEGRPLLIKSPQHTARLRHLLDMFPDARFVHIHRHPYEVYRSTMRLHRIGSTLANFQPPRPELFHGRVLRQYTEMFDAFFAARSAIPDNRFVEIGYAELRQDPLRTLGRIYERLGLDGFGERYPQLQETLKGLAGYQPNRYADLEEATRREIGAAWGRSFATWGYEP